ncbi:MAG: hypothetical protein ACQGVK_14690 [Myxococcota bacterium]
MSSSSAPRLRALVRRILPWVISAGTLGYVFGYAIEWDAIPEATAGADLPLFIAITVADKILFFVVWGVLQARVVERFVEPVSVGSVLSIKGGSELVRTFANSLGDAAFALGVSQLARGSLAAVVAVVMIPFGCHFGILLTQATLALPLLEGGLSGNRDVLALVVAGWGIVAGVVLTGRLGVWRRLLAQAGLIDWFDRVDARGLWPFFGWFALFAACDVLIQGAASRAFGVAIPWIDLTARIPLLYFALAIPSFGNFGPREIMWAAAFADHAPRETLIAFALWTNAIFMAMHAVIGMLFFGRALELLRQVRGSKSEADRERESRLPDAIEP